MTKIKRNLNPPSKKDVFEHQVYDSKILLDDYESLYLGKSTDHETRQRGSSGGVATELFSHLLDKGKVDGVISVKMCPHKSVPIYGLATSSQELKDFTGSKYAYLPFIELRDLLVANQDMESLAVIVQPCHVNVVRSLQKKKFKNIKYVFSFFCGYNIGREATSYLINKTNVDSKDIEQINYRGGDYPGGFEVIKKNGDSVRFGKESYELVDIMFLLKGCHRCPFYMGENADIVFGDAWLKEHKNLTAVIARTDHGEKTLRELYLDKKIVLYHLREHDLVKMHWHNLKYKKYGHSLFLKVIVFIFRDFLPSWSIPFSLMSRISKIRRKFKIGITINELEEVKVEESL